jgi:hypothetical protein
MGGKNSVGWTCNADVIVDAEHLYLVVIVVHTVDIAVHIVALVVAAHWHATGTQ